MQTEKGYQTPYSTHLEMLGVQRGRVKLLRSDHGTAVTSGANRRPATAGSGGSRCSGGGGSNGGGVGGGDVEVGGGHGGTHGLFEGIQQTENVAHDDRAVLLFVLEHLLHHDRQGFLAVAPVEQPQDVLPFVVAFLGPLLRTICSYLHVTCLWSA